MGNVVNAKIIGLMILISLVSGISGSLITIKLHDAIDFEDGIPFVDDPEHPNVDGNSMTPNQFLNEFCDNERAKFSKTCIAVQKAAKRRWNPLGDIPNFWRK